MTSMTTARVVTTILLLGGPRHTYIVVTTLAVVMGRNALFANFSLFIEPTRKLHVMIVGHTLAHLRVFVEMRAQVEQLRGFLPGESFLYKIVDEHINFMCLGGRCFYGSLLGGTLVVFGWLWLVLHCK